MSQENNPKVVTALSLVGRNVYNAGAYVVEGIAIVVLLVLCVLLRGNTNYF